MSSLDTGYVAGIIDARGHVSIERAAPRVRVTTRRLDLITWLADHTGTTVKLDEHGYQRRACSEHCSDRHQHVERQSAYWNVGGARAVIVLWNTYPWLVCQRQVVTEVSTPARCAAMTSNNPREHGPRQASHVSPTCRSASWLDIR